MMTINLTDDEAAYLRSLLGEAQESLSDSLGLESPDSHLVEQDYALTNSILGKLALFAV